MTLALFTTDYSQLYIFSLIFFGLIVSLLFTGKLMDKYRTPWIFPLALPISFILWPFALINMFWKWLKEKDEDGLF